jgi:pyruvate formate lyase activating enzyme
MVDIHLSKQMKKESSMSISLYTATGCVRCKLVRQFLKERNLTFREYDSLGEGKEAFRPFYQANRQKIYRGAEGVEFPIYFDGEVIRQGLPGVIAHLIAGPSLNGFFTHGRKHGQWIDGIHVSGGDPAYGEEFLEVLIYLKKQGFKIQIATNGLNADLLSSVIDHKLAACVIMEVKGSLDLYGLLLQHPVAPAEIEKSIILVSKLSEYRFFTSIVPIVRQPGDTPEISYITPEEVAQAAKLIETATGDNRQPYGLRFLDPKIADDERLRTCEALSPSALFQYRTLARKHQFKTEILKE